ncbi:MAG: OsmC family protein [Bdellovibrionaceae bacterium]|nr:OsmC family protein [Pseudobdellovibrionaceae bacterium]
MGDETAITPKQMLRAAICGCTGMDVVALLNKHKQPLSKFEIEAEALVTEGAHPILFKVVELVFKLEGALEKEKVLEAITLNLTKENYENKYSSH